MTRNDGQHPGRLLALWILLGPIAFGVGGTLGSYLATAFFDLPDLLPPDSEPSIHAAMGCVTVVLACVVPLGLGQALLLSRPCGSWTVATMVGAVFFPLVALLAIKVASLGVAIGAGVLGSVVAQAAVISRDSWPNAAAWWAFGFLGLVSGLALSAWITVPPTLKYEVFVAIQLGAIGTGYAVGTAPGLAFKRS